MVRHKKSVEFTLSFIIVIFALAFLSGSCTQQAEIDTSREEGIADSDLASIVQLALDLEHLQPFLHADLPDRESLCVSGPGLPDDLGLMRHGLPVSIVSAGDFGDRCIIFDSIEVENRLALVRFRYPIEGVACTIALRRGEGGWSVVVSELYEKYH